MKRYIPALTIGLGTALLMPAPAAAQQANNCAERAKVLEHLTSRYGETRQSIGISSENSVIEVFASPDTGTWTITVTLPTGVTCLVASGEAFESIEEDLRPTSGNDA